MNYLVFNNTAQLLSSVFYGTDGSVYRPIAVDASGNVMISSASAVAVTATNLDIRDLTDTRDTVNVVATALDIRSLSGTQDSVEIYSQGFVENNVSTNVVSGTNILLTTDIGSYSENSFFLRNTGGATVTVTLEVAPVDNNSYYVTNVAAQGVAPNNNYLQAVTVPVKYARLNVAAGTTVSVVAYYNGRA